VKNIECQGRSIVTTDDVADDVVSFSVAARRRGRVVRIDVPVADDAHTHVPLIGSPGETLVVRDCPNRAANIDAAALIESLASRRTAWTARAEPGAESRVESRATSRTNRG
jgi:hypothetical protein